MAFIVLLVVFSSGCISSSTNETKTFVDGAMIFNYPTDFDNVSLSDNNSNSSSSMHAIGKFENSVPMKVQTINVYKNINPTSPSEMRDKLISNLKNMSSGEILSITNETNPNGIAVEKATYKYDLNVGVKAFYSDLFFKISDNVYIISVSGADTTISTQNVRNTSDIIFQSIKNN